MRRTLLVAIGVLAAVLAAQPRPSGAQATDDAKIRQLEEQLLQMQREITTLKDEQTETKKQVGLMPKLKEWLADLDFSGSVTLRYDLTEVEDRQDIFLEDDEIEGLRTRDRLGVTYHPDGPVHVGLRISTGGNPNPTSPFVRPGDAFRSKNIYFDRFYFIVRPLKFFDTRPWDDQPLQVSFHVGKMPQPLWLGDRGTWASELVWDQDVSPEGIALKLAAPHLSPFFGLEATGAYYIIEQLDDLRFSGLTADTYMVAAQLLAKIKPAQRTGVNLAFTFYDYENLNAGARSPTFDPANVVVTPGQTAFLLRPGFQVTNNRLDLGVGAVAFVEESFQIINPAGEVYFGLPFLDPITPEVFLYGEYIQNLSVDQDEKGYGATIGLRAGKFGSGINPFAVWFTYRDVDEDATLATFADSDLGAGTGYKGFEVAGYYRLHKNLQFQISYFDFDGFPFKVNGVQRIFFDLTASF